jgi:hypothetical protein
VSRRTVPAGDLHPDWLDPGVRPVPLDTTTPARMQRAAIQACLSPVFLPNVVLAGERRLVAQLHRPLARTAPTVAGLYSCLWVFLRTGPTPITNPQLHPTRPSRKNSTLRRLDLRPRLKRINAGPLRDATTGGSRDYVRANTRAEVYRSPAWR